MKTQKITMNEQQLEQVAESLRATLSNSLTPCLTDEEFVEYTMALLSHDDTRRIRDHLASCEECAEEANRLVEGASAWQGKQGEQRLTALRQKIESQWTLATPPALEEPQSFIAKMREELRRFLESVSYDLGFATSAHGGAPPQPLDRASANESFSLFIKEDKERNVVIRIAALAPELEEPITIRLSAGEAWRKEAVLARIDDDQIGAEVMIPFAERKNLPEGTKLFATVV